MYFLSVFQSSRIKVSVYMGAGADPGLMKGEGGGGGAKL